MNSNILFSLTIIFLSSYYLKAQNELILNNIDNNKKEIIIRELNLNNKQIEEFWPIYQKYNKENRKLRIEFLSLQNEIDDNSTTDDDVLFIEKVLNIKEKNLDLKKQLYKDISKILTSKQIVKLTFVEEEFKRMLIHTIKEKHPTDKNNFNAFPPPPHHLRHTPPPKNR